MRKNTVIVAILVVAAYLVGTATGKARGMDYEDVRHQVERIWKSPDAKKSRRKLAKKAGKKIEKARKGLSRK